MIFNVISLMIFFTLDTFSAFLRNYVCEASDMWGGGENTKIQKEFQVQSNVFFEVNLLPPFLLYSLKDFGDKLID
jgi:hypothetical protein